MEQKKSKHVEGGAVVVVAIVGKTKILLIKETTKPLPHFWKLVSETVEPGEPILNTLWSGVQEEAGLELGVRREDGEVVDFVDDRADVVEACPPHWVPHKYRPHTRYFYGIITSDAIIQSLSGQHLIGDENEKIETQAFDLAELEGMVDFIPKQRELIEKLRQKAST